MTRPVQRRGADVTDALMAICECAPGSSPLRAPAGTVLFRPQEPCRGFLALKHGSIKVSLTSASGREIVLYRVQPGEICLQTFSCLAQDQTYAAEGVAEEDVEGVLAPRAVWDRLMASDAGFRAAVMAAIARRFADFEQVVETLAFAGLEQRLSGALIRLADADGVVRATHEALAAEIGSAREAVSRMLASLAKQTLIETSRGQVRLLRPDALARLTQ
jgi:CRP/FNR family transcriptional regulator, anaerobic regulatory protein